LPPDYDFDSSEDDDENVDSSTNFNDATVPVTPPPIQSTAAMSCEITEFITTIKQSCTCKDQKHTILINQHEDDFRRIAHETLGLNKKELRQRVFDALINQTHIKRLDSDKLKISYIIPYFGIVCLPIFKKFYSCDDRRLKRIRREIRANRSIIMKRHGNACQQNRVLPELVQQKLRAFFTELQLRYGESIAARRYKRQPCNGQIRVTIENVATVYLPSHFSARALHRRFLEANESFNRSDLPSRSNFESYWRKPDWFPNLKIKPPSSDICDECSILRTQIADMDDEMFSLVQIQSPEGLSVVDSLTEHVLKYRSMRDDYEKDIAACRSDDPARPIVLSFDFAQNVGVPHFEHAPAQTSIAACSL
jgi:hypothetical protein